MYVQHVSVIRKVIAKQKQNQAKKTKGENLRTSSKHKQKQNKISKPNNKWLFSCFFFFFFFFFWGGGGDKLTFICYAFIFATRT